VRPEAVIAAQDLKSIYEAPLAYHAEGLDQAVLDAFGSRPRRGRTWRWEDVVDRIHNPEGEVRIAIVGKYTQLEDAYKSIAEALTHGGIANRVKVRGVDRREIFEREEIAPLLEGFHAILVPGGFGERGTEGKIRAAASRASAGALSRHLPRHADGGDRGGAEPSGMSRRRARRSSTTRPARGGSPR
jgi:CTP synthase